MVQSSFFSSYLIRQPVAVVVASQKGKKKKLNLTGFKNTIFTYWKAEWSYTKAPQEQVYGVMEMCLSM